MHWLVFDYGEVLSRRTEALPGLAALLGADPAEFEAAYWAERESYDRGCTDLEYWAAVGARLGLTVDTTLADELTAGDVAGWLAVEPESLALLDELHAGGVALALLSNAPSSFGAAVRQQSWAGYFRHLLFSGDLRIAKPDEQIWRALADTLRADTGDCVFFDDRQINIDGARRAGLTAELWPGAVEIRPRLHDLGLLKER